MKNSSINCVILGHRDFTENDRLIFMYCEEFGKIKVIAKGARKITSKFTGHLETLNFSLAGIYFGPHNIILQEIITIKNFKKIRDRLDTLSAAMQIAKITNKILYENQKIEKLMELLSQTMQHLSSSSKTALTAQSYIMKIFDRSGLIPDFKEIHGNLEQKYLKLFHFLKTQPLNQIEKISLDQQEKETVNQVMEKIVSYSL